jgi:polyvinyl alcohol dehydrogenase (cytochrome)
MIRKSRLGIAGLLLVNFAGVALAQAQNAQVKAQGQAVFQRLCALCHLSLVPTAGKAPATPDARAVPVELLKRYSPEAILTALTTGKMQAQGATLTPDERKAVAQFIAGRPFGPVQVATVTAGQLCEKRVPMADPATTMGWSGWGNGLDNARFQDKAQGGLTAADLPHLKLKWAFGYANVPAAAGGGGRATLRGERQRGRVRLGPGDGLHLLDVQGWCRCADGALGRALSHGYGHILICGAVR